MDLANLKRYACFGDGDMCSLNLKHDDLDAIQTYFKFEDVVELLKQADNSAITPPDERDCDTCNHDGTCLVTVLKCKGYQRAAQ